MFDAETDYAEACNPDRWKILGVRLKPFCEGHRLLLKRIGSPFVNGGAVNGLAFLSALMICSMSYEKGQKFVAGRRSIKAIILTIFVALVGSILPSFLNRRAEALANYMQEAERLPKGIFRSTFGPDGKPVEKTHAPAALVFESDICNHYHCSFSEVMNMPMRKATFLRYRLLETDKLIRWRAPWMGQPPKQTEAANG